MGKISCQFEHKLGFAFMTDVITPAHVKERRVCAEGALSTLFVARRQR
jgi:hypothetical protein